MAKFIVDIEEVKPGPGCGKVLLWIGGLAVIVVIIMAIASGSSSSHSSYTPRTDDLPSSPRTPTAQPRPRQSTDTPADPAHGTTPSLVGAPLAPTSPLAKWQEAENTHDTKALEALYSDRVCFYHADLTREECLAKLQELYAKMPKYTQSIDPNSVLIQRRDGSGWVRLEFDKTYSTSGIPEATRAYLVLDQNGRILVEGDVRTDTNMKAKPTQGRCAGAEGW